MNFSKKLVQAGLAVTLILVPACAHHRHGGGGKTTSKCGVTPCGQGPGAGHHYGQMDRTFEVYIYTDREDPTKCYADVDVATLWTMTQKHNGKPVHQTVTWFSDDGKPYIVDFRKGQPGTSPFDNPLPYYKVPASGSIPSGDLKQVSGYYEFAILPGTDPDTKDVCRQASDPGYRVSP